MSQQIVVRALLTITVAAAALAAAATALPPAVHGWHLAAGASATDVLEPFTIGLRWSNEHHLDDAHNGVLSPEARAILRAREAASPGFASIEAAISGWRKLVAPDEGPEGVAPVRAWLKRAGASEHCQRKWDHFACEGVPVAVGRKLFGGVNFGKYVHSSLPAGRQRRQRVLTPLCPKTLVDRLRRGPAKLAAVTAVTGLSLYNVDVLLNARQQVNKPTIPRKTVAPAATNLGAGIQWPNPGNGEPVLLNVMSQGPTSAGIIFAPFCADGTVPTAFFGLSCTNASDAPVSATLGLHNATHSWNQKAPSLQCTTNAQIGPNPYCEILVSTGVAAWTEYGVNLTVTFKNGKTTAAVGMKNFNATHFEPASVQPNIARFFMEQQAGPDALHALYDVPASAQPAVGAWKTSNVTQAVIELSGIATGAFSMADLASYMTNHGVTTYKPAMVQKVGPDETEAAGEATLDIEMIMGVAQNTASVFYSQVAGESLNGWIVKWLRKLTDPSGVFTHKAPSVWSCSYGGPDVDDLTHLWEAEKYFKFLSASGITFHTASGDSGAWGGKISYPASSNFNIAVGATASRQPAAAGGDTDVCTAHHNDMITSSGGFSSTTKAPSHQSGFIPSGTTGRGLPDISALGSYLNMVQGGQSQPVWGTSASSPISAGLVSLANTARAAKGLPTLAFANRFIYEGAGKSSFTDIASGSNCYGRSAGLSLGFKSWTKCYDAVKGWDASTGRGTINFPHFVDAALKWTNPAPPPPMPTPPPQPPTTKAPMPPVPTMSPNQPPMTPTPMGPSPSAAPPAPPSANGTFTQYACNSSSCSPTSDCQAHTFNQGACLQNEEGGSATVKCDGSSLMFFTIYPSSKDCTGFKETNIQFAGVCEGPTEGGQYLKDVCHNGATAAMIETAAAVRLPPKKQQK